MSQQPRQWSAEDIELEAERLAWWVYPNMERAAVWPALSDRTKAHYRKLAEASLAGQAAQPVGARGEAGEAIRFIRERLELSRATGGMDPAIASALDTLSRALTPAAAPGGAWEALQSAAKGLADSVFADHRSPSQFKPSAITLRHRDQVQAALSALRAEPQAKEAPAPHEVSKQKTEGRCLMCGKELGEMQADAWARGWSQGFDAAMRKQAKQPQASGPGRTT